MSSTDYFMDDDGYRLTVAAAILHIAQLLSSVESDEERRRKKQLVVQRKVRTLQEAFPHETAERDLNKLGGALELFPRDIGRQDALRLLVDISFSSPFAPYELKFSASDFRDALLQVASRLRLWPSDVTNVEETKREAFSIHSKISWGKIGLFAVTGTVVLAAGGWIAAPAIGTALGSAAGLSGAAATAHGLALLGGGSLAMGGAGMAGGAMAVTGFSAFAGCAALGGGSLLVQLGAANAQLELVKLQTTFKVVILGTQTQLAKTQKIIARLTEELAELATQLRAERELNESNSARLEELEATVRALEVALEWIRRGGR